VAVVGLALAVGAGAGGYFVEAAQDPSSASPQQAPQTSQTSQTSQTPQTPTFRAGVNFVRVDVIATDKTGAIVSNLEPQDFEVTEQGKPQKVETFKLVSLDGGLMATGDQTPRPIRNDDDEQREANRDDVRLFAIFLDDYHVKVESSLGAREQIARFVDTQLGPSDMVGVMYPLESLESVLMTRDHDAVKRGIERFLGRKYNYEPKNAIEEKYQHYPSETVEQIRNQVSLSALKGLIIHLGTLREGRKALILVSEGYSDILPPQLRDVNAAVPGSGNPNRDNPLAGASGTNINENRAQNAASLNVESELRDVYEEANHYNVSIYAVDPRMLATNEFGVDMPAIDTRVDQQYLNSTMDTLRTLALETDGRAIVNRNDLTIAMKQIVRDTSAYYLLGYNSTFTAPDGKFHEIKVRVKRSGVEVRARKGYWALNREEAAVVSAPPRPKAPTAVENALNAAAVTSQSRLVRTWIGTERGDDGKTRVTFVWEPVPKLPGDTVRASDQPSRVAVTAAGGDGAPYFRGSVPDIPHGAAAGPSPPPGAPPPAGSGGRVVFEAPPGKMELRLAVEGSGSDVLDSETREIVVPDLTAPQTVLSTPEVFRARTARELQQLKADPQPVPVVGRDFSRVDRLLIRVSAYGPGSTPPKLTARLLSRAGQPMVDLPVTPPASPGEVSQIEIPLAAIATGEYLIEIDATGDGGPAQELVGFRVVA
jgi:VWFA-related protein